MGVSVAIRCKSWYCKAIPSYSGGQVQPVVQREPSDFTSRVYCVG